MPELMQQRNPTWSTDPVRRCFTFAPNAAAITWCSVSHPPVRELAQRDEFEPVAVAAVCPRQSLILSKPGVVLGEVGRASDQPERKA